MEAWGAVACAALLFGTQGAIGLKKTTKRKLALLPAFAFGDAWAVAAWAGRDCHYWARWVVAAGVGGWVAARAPPARAWRAFAVGVLALGFGTCAWGEVYPDCESRPYPDYAFYCWEVGSALAVLLLPGPGFTRFGLGGALAVAAAASLALAGFDFVGAPILCAFHLAFALAAARKSESDAPGADLAPFPPPGPPGLGPRAAVATDTDAISTDWGTASLLRALDVGLPTSQDVERGGDWDSFATAQRRSNAERDDESDGRRVGARMLTVHVAFPAQWDQAPATYRVPDDWLTDRFARHVGHERGRVEGKFDLALAPSGARVVPGRFREQTRGDVLHLALSVPDP